MPSLVSCCDHRLAGRGSAKDRATSVGGVSVLRDGSVLLVSRCEIHHEVLCVGARDDLHGDDARDAAGSNVRAMDRHAHSSQRKSKMMGCGSRHWLFLDALRATFLQISPSSGHVTIPITPHSGEEWEAIDRHRISVIAWT